jgi:hypothetical protein
MQNVTYKVTGDKLVIEVDLSAKAVSAARESSTGKTKLLASTQGATPLPATVGGRHCTFALNVMLKG